ncbi:hypothetical protein ATK36_2654 [Amycolatopsis sulphurea]|uniref:Excreted virulence factor EspC (Type VII ESX diderm) n=2 Tax=Amycolatopsis sulphurea TaxID=76022 RepID=A0A2A9F860_9PSEU|nr:hypothetical protein [Amycolatopsis sulphurea]PFG47607.1 hypothetical protein ATK36_2654 [Amycolatopsis sulphurea]
MSVPGPDAVRIDSAVVGGYAAKVARATDELAAAAAEVGQGATRPETYGGLGADLGVGESYAVASGILRRQLGAGVAALRSVTEALEQLTSGHEQRDVDAAERIERAGWIS